MNKNRKKMNAKMQKRNKKKRKKNQTSVNRTRTHTPGTEAAVKYFFASTQPWNSPPVGLPMEPALRSSKQKFWTKGRVETGLQGVGFIAGTGGWCGDTASLYHSLTAFNLTSIQASGVGVNALPTNSTYSYNDFNVTATTNQLQARLVASGMRVRYIGTELNRGGRILAFEHPDHDSLVGYTAEDVLAFPNTSFEVVDRRWHSAHWTHKWPGEENYDFFCEPRAKPGEVVSSNPTYGMFLEAPPSVSSVFEFEYYVIVEIIGSIVASISSPSVSHNQKTNTLKSKLAQATPVVKSALGALPVKRIESTAVGILSKENPEVGNIAKSAMPILNTLAPMAMSLL